MNRIKKISLGISKAFTLLYKFHYQILRLSGLDNALVLFKLLLVRSFPGFL